MGITMRSTGSQRSIFDGTTPLKITKPIRLIELFAGIGAQAKAVLEIVKKYGYPKEEEMKRLQEI